MNELFVKEVIKWQLDMLNIKKRAQKLTDETVENDIK